jgi:uncharacterized membrane protein
VRNKKSAFGGILPERFHAGHRQMVALPVAVLVFALTWGRVNPVSGILLTWNVYAGLLLVLSWIIMVTREPQALLKVARLEDSTLALLLFFLIGSACMSLVAVVFVLSQSEATDPHLKAFHLALAMLTVVESWCLIHTTFAMHYAHVYYRDAGDDEVPGTGGGLLFPKEPRPDFLDFAYYSFVVGMTCQVADVDISSRVMRRLTLIHGVIAFVFNTSILALFINLLSSVL